MENTEPYGPRKTNGEPRMDQYSIRQILKSKTWRRGWERVRKEVGGDFAGEDAGEAWRQRVWEMVV